MNITYGVGSTFDGWHVDLVVHRLGWPINVLITDGTTLYPVINTLHGSDNPTTFARITLIP